MKKSHIIKKPKVENCSIFEKSLGKVKTLGIAFSRVEYILLSLLLAGIG